MNQTDYIIGGIVFFLLGLGAIVAFTPADAGEKDLVTLSDKNTVILNVPIMEDSTRDIQLELLDRSARLNANDSIYLILNSPGGSIADGLKLINTARSLPQKVQTISLFSASMSFVISQALDKRYVTDNSTLMSHKAYLGGVEGTIPGTFTSRVNFILAELLSIDTFISKRAGLSVTDYRKLTEDELWMDGPTALTSKFADQLVRIRCDKTLNGAGPTRSINMGFMSFKATFHKCPLITQPLSSGGDENLVNMVVNNKPEFIHRYIDTGLILRGGK